MNGLPTEILNQIFILFHQQDKVECMKVCRQWENAIKSFSLFHTIRISSNTQLNKLIEKARKETMHRSKVERIILDLFLEPDFDINTLVYLFPNVRSFSTTKAYSTCSSQNKSQLSPKSWYNIEEFSQYNNNTLISQILASATCPHLTKIMIEGGSKQSGRDFISLLTNAPALKVLSISGFFFTLMDFDLLHENVTMLNALTILTTNLDCQVLPSEIKPTTSITTLKIGTDLFSAENGLTLLQYIRLKYPVITDLSYHVTIWETTDPRIEMVYRDGLAPFMKGLGPQLKKLDLGLNSNTETIFQILDDTDCQIQELHLDGIITSSKLQQLKYTHIVKYIQKMTVDAIFHGANLNWVNGFTSLRELNLCFSLLPVKDKLNLSDLLSVVGHTLQSLQLRGVELKFDPLAIRQYPLLKKLSLNCVSLPMQLDAFLFQSFPNLRSLIFKSCEWISRYFILPNIDLAYLEVTERFLDESNKILVTTHHNNQSRWYATRSKHVIDYFIHDRASDAATMLSDACAYPATVSLPYDQYTGLPYMTFACNSLHTFFMANSAH